MAKITSGLPSGGTGTSTHNHLQGLNDGYVGPTNTYPITTYIGFSLAGNPQNNITNAYGVRITDLYGTTTARGIDLNVTSGAVKYNVYAGGTAKNYLHGNTLFVTFEESWKSVLNFFSTTPVVVFLVSIS